MSSTQNISFGEAKHRRELQFIQEVLSDKDKYPSWEPAAKGKPQTPHPLYKYFGHGEIAQLAKSIIKPCGKAISREYLAYMLTGVKTWNIAEGGKGILKRKILIEAAKFAFDKIERKRELATKKWNYTQNFAGRSNKRTQKAATAA